MWQHSDMPLHKLTFVIAIIAILIIVGGSLRTPAQPPEETARFVIVSDAKHPTPAFVQSFAVFDHLIIKWWEIDGSRMVSQRWRVEVSEKVRGSEPLGLRVIVKNMSRGGKSVLNELVRYNTGDRPAAWRAAELAIQKVIEKEKETANARAGR